MDTKLNNSNNKNLEEVSQSARSGFDTSGKIPKKTIGTIPIIISVILMAVVFYYFVGSMFTPVRNCVGSINGAPECSDCSTKSMKTTVNGKSVGKCTANPGTGKYSDQCTLNCPK
jgi:hypothetical protein